MVEEAVVEQVDWRSKVDGVKNQIRERDPVMVEDNFKRAIRALSQVYEDKLAVKVNERTGLWDRLRRNREGESFEDRIQGFVETYGQGVYEVLTHVTDVEIPVDDGDYATLVAPKDLERARRSGKDDMEMGSLEYVFASMGELRPRGGRGGGNVFHIEIPSADENNEIYGVPCDIADLQLGAVAPEEVDYDEINQLFKLEVYRDNIFKWEDFKIFFAAYCACFFDTPEEALSFFSNKRVRTVNQQSSPWSERTLNNEPDEIRPKLIEMAQLMRKQGIVPPIAPEVQIKDSVQAKFLRQQ